jgi:hypothetical protein
MRPSSKLRRLARTALPLALLCVWGCATTQEVPLGCVAEEVQVYVDGRLLEGRPESIDLSVGDPHKLYFKRPGHEPQLVVLESREGPDGSLRLEPADVCVELIPVGLGRELVIEAEEGPDAP